jgi:hypothetical protein
VHRVYFLICDGSDGLSCPGVDLSVKRRRGETTGAEAYCDLPPPTNGQRYNSKSPRFAAQRVQQQQPSTVVLALYLSR